MIQLIIVDDEETTRESLMDLVPWSELGIDSVKCAQNGLDALELAENYTPDIILTDVRMPKMDGIELAKSVRDLYPDCEILFLSAFSDKEYLKSAIQLNAIDYLEKPIDIEELISAIQSTLQKVQANKKKSAEEVQLKNKLIENIHLLRQEIVLGLVSGTSDPHSILNKYEAEVLEIATEKIFTIVSVAFNWVSKTNMDEISSTKNSILKTLNVKEPLGNIKFLCGFINDIHLVLVIVNEINHKYPEHVTFIEDLSKQILNYSFENFTITVSISNPVYNTSLLPNAYKSTLEMLKQQFYIGLNKIIYPDSVHQSSYEVEKNTFAKFKKLLRNNMIDDAIQYVRNLTRDISFTHDPDIGKIKNIYFTLLMNLLEVSLQLDTIASVGDSESRSIWQELDSQLTLYKLSDFLIANIETIYRKSEDMEASSNKINEITRFILDNYMSNQLSIQSISAYTFLSPTYLCAFFKKSTGKTLNEYITELRIEKAKELLKDTSIKLYEVASGIGFTDTNYFSTLFKKFTRLTPSEFREKHIYDKKNS